VICGVGLGTLRYTLRREQVGRDEQMRENSGQ